MKVKCNSDGIAQAVKIFQKGGTLVFPTDTVYGLGCDPFNSDAVKSIYKIKNRDSVKSLPVLGYSKKELEQIVVFSEKAQVIAEKFWPGPLTLVLEIKDKKIAESLNLKDRIAVRVPDNQCLLEILKQCKFIVGTSANVSGVDSFTDPDLCSSGISGYDLFVDGGIISSKGESTIIEILDDKINILREGIIKESEMESLF